jgi:hypothetical protein
MILCLFIDTDEPDFVIELLRSDKHVKGIYDATKIHGCEDMTLFDIEAELENK